METEECKQREIDGERWRERGTGWECGGGFSGVQREIGEREWVEGGCSEPFILTLPGDIMSV